MRDVSFFPFSARVSLLSSLFYKLKIKPFVAVIVHLVCYFAAPRMGCRSDGKETTTFSR